MFLGYPNLTGSRKSWAAPDAAKRGFELAWFTIKGEQGYASSFSAKKWGFKDVIFKSKDLILNKKLSSYVMENILFKVSYPCEFHAQTAIEAAVIIYDKLIKVQKYQLDWLQISDQLLESRFCLIFDSAVSKISTVILLINRQKNNFLNNLFLICMMNHNRGNRLLIILPPHF